MPLPRAFLPLRHATFRMLWIATLASNVGTWIQNTGAAWLMTSLDPSPVMVSLVQVASLLPVFLLALPAGALADIVDRRLFLIGAQLWITLIGLLLAVLTATDALGPWGLLALTFGVGIGFATNFPAWAATAPELVPREDLVSAIALNGISFNIARAIGPALGGFVIAAAGPEAAFALNTVAFLGLIVALWMWRREPSSRRLPKEQLASAMRAGLRFVWASPAMHAAIGRACTFFLFAAAVWGLLPLLVRGRLGLGPEAYGLMLAVVGGSAVGAGFVLPALRARLDSNALVLWSSVLAAAGMAMMAAFAHWAPVALGLAAYGCAWITAGSTLSAAAQLAAPAWVRARGIAIFQLCFFGAMAFGSALSGWLGAHFGVATALGTFAAGGAVAAVLTRGWRLQVFQPVVASTTPLPRPEAPDAALRPLLGEESGRVLEAVRYVVDPDDRATFLAAMQEVRRVRFRSGAVSWRLYEDVAHPERWVELWAVESWTEHLREQDRGTEADQNTLATATGLHRGQGAPEAARYLAILP